MTRLIKALIAQSYLLALITHAAPAAAADAGRAKFVRCSVLQAQRCEIMLKGLTEDDLPPSGQPVTLELYRAGTVVYRATRLAPSQRPLGSPNLHLVTDGLWFINTKARAQVLRSRPMLTYVLTTKRSPVLVTAAGGAGSADALDTLDTLGTLGTHGTGPADDEDSAASEEASAATSRARTTKASKSTDASDEPSTFAQFEDWLTTSGGDDYHRIVASARAGTPQSPSAMLGGGLDLFLFSRVMPLSVAYGEYSSARYLRKEHGSVQYHTVSAGSAILVGRSATRFKIGLMHTRIDAKVKAGQTGMIKESFTRTYSGLSPSLGLYGISKGGFTYGVDWGRFVTSSKHFTTDVGAPVTKADAKAPYKNKNVFINVSLGLAF